jgi:endonuclease/exonuclease/phosphatase family metal-dependent hydrolase
MPRKRRIRWFLAALCIVAALVYASAQRLASGPAAGTTFEGMVAAAPVAQRTFLVGLYNIHGGRGIDGQRNLARTADALRGFDLIGLNETLGPKLWAGHDQCQQLGGALGMRWLFAPTESRWWDGSFGNGMLSSLPVTSWHRIPLPRAGSHTYRNALLTTTEVGGRAVHVLLTHLDSRDVVRRQEQLRTLGDLFLSLSAPAIFMGDLNSPPDDPQLKRLLVTPGVADAVGESLADISWPRIDWILTRGLRTIRGGCEDNGASDHPLYWAELEIVD